MSWLDLLIHNAAPQTQPVWPDWDDAPRPETSTADATALPDSATVSQADSTTRLAADVTSTAGDAKTSTAEATEALPEPAAAPTTDIMWQRPLPPHLKQNPFQALIWYLVDDAITNDTTQDGGSSADFERALNRLMYHLEQAETAIPFSQRIYAHAAIDLQHVFLMRLNPDMRTDRQKFFKIGTDVLSIDQRKHCVAVMRNVPDFIRFRQSILDNLVFSLVAAEPLYSLTDYRHVTNTAHFYHSLYASSRRPGPPLFVRATTLSTVTSEIKHKIPSLQAFPLDTLTSLSNQPTFPWDSDMPPLVDLIDADHALQAIGWHAAQRVESLITKDPESLSAAFRQLHEQLFNDQACSFLSNVLASICLAFPSFWVSKVHLKASDKELNPRILDASYLSTLLVNRPLLQKSSRNFLPLTEQHDSQTGLFDPTARSGAALSSSGLALRPCTSSIHEFSGHQAFKSLTEPLPLRLIEVDLWAWQQDLDAHFPWMKPVTLRLMRRLMIQQEHGLPLHLPTLALYGPPGSGKTSYCMAAVEALNHPFTLQDLSGSNSSALIKGTEAGWSSATPSLPAHTMVQTGCANSVILLDEVDKTSNSSQNGYALNALLPLLERSTAQHYYDNCLKTALNASALSWLLMLNDIDALPGPFRSRVEPILVEGPDLSRPDHLAAALSMSERVAAQRWQGVASKRFGLTHDQRQALTRVRWHDLRSLSQAVQRMLEENLFEQTIEHRLERNDSKSSWLALLTSTINRPGPSSDFPTPSS